MLLIASEPDHVAPQPPRLLDRMREKLRVKHYSIRTEQSYLDWARRYIRFHQMRHPSELGAQAVEAFLTALAVKGNVAASTQNQAKSALLFLYRDVLGIELRWLQADVSAKHPQRLAAVLTRDQTTRLLENMTGVPALVARLLYGSGMRILEGVRLRVKDLDLPRGEVLVRDGKGGKDRMTVLPRKSRRAPQAAVRVRADIAREGPRRWFRVGLPAQRSRTKVPERLSRMGLAVRVSCGSHLRGSAFGH